LSRHANRAGARRLPCPDARGDGSVACAAVHTEESGLAHWIYRPAWQIRYRKFWQK
jgi:hypothetical protein